MLNQQVNNFLLSKVSLKRLELIVLDIPQKEVFVSAIGHRKSRKALIIKWINKNGIVGYGECSCRPDPFYSHEFVEASLLLINDFIFPLVKNAITYKQVLDKLAKVRGWNFTKAAIEFAMNDTLRREGGIGIIESWGGQPIAKVPVGISLGLFDSLQSLAHKLNEVEQDNYQRIKFKINCNYNDPAIHERIQALDHNNISFDANGSFSVDSFELLNRFASMGYTIEQPFLPGEIYQYQDYIEHYKPFSICLDEDIESYGNLVSLRSEMNEVNIKPGRVGGLYNTLKMIDFCHEHNLHAWIGGMFESGIGRAQNLQLASLLPDAKAHDLSPSSRYFTKDVLQEPISMDNGFINTENFMHVEVNDEALDSMTVNKIILVNE